MVDQSKVKAVQIALWIQTSVPFLFLLARLYTKRRLRNPFGLDDWLLGLSWILCFIYSIHIHLSTLYGIGLHYKDTDPLKLLKGTKLMFIGELFVLIAMPVGKTSFCVTLLRITTTKWHRRVMWFIMLTLNPAMLVVAAMTFLRCNPIEKAWNYGAPGRCWPRAVIVNYSIFLGVYSCLIDLVLAICPWLIIYQLQIRDKFKKYTLMGTMSLGIFAGVACAIKTSYIPLLLGGWADHTWRIADVLIWGLAESSIMIIAASIPNMLRLADKAQEVTFPLQGITTDNIKTPGSRHNDDSSSDRSILGHLKRGGIMRTDEVQVQVA